MTRVLLVLMMAVPLACATAPAGERRGSSREITREEIEAALGASTTFDVVQRLRPQWLRYRGPSSLYRDGAIVVYVDGIRSGVVVGDGTSTTGPNPLSGIAAERAQRILYYSATVATQKFGTGHAHGAIEVLTRR